jgi:aerobic-type carbon monoxide dehydrogenase small subunit (CoxS/CutS family)
MSSETITFSIILNGKPTAPQQVPADMPLIDFLNDEAGLTGTKFCCGIGVCRACTVAVQRVPGAHLEPLLSCSTGVAQVNGQAITTVEGLADANGLSPLQTAFLESFAFQCGYSTPGFLMGAHVLMDGLRRNPVTADQVDQAIQGAVGQHVCRCTGYVRYYAAIRKVILATPGLVK